MSKTTIKDEKIVRLNFDLPVSMRNAFKAKAAMEGLTVKQALTRLIEGYLKGNGQKKPK